MFDIVAGAKYVCVPSECYENNPMTIVEAYSLSTPVIGAAIGGISEIVLDAETGYTFESGNIESLVSTIEKASKLNKNAYLQQRQRSYEFGLEHFSRENYIRKLIAFYQSLIDYFLRNNKK